VDLSVVALTAGVSPETLLAAIIEGRFWSRP